MDPFGIGTWIADRLLRWRSERPRLALTIRTDDDNGPWFAFVYDDGRMSSGPPARRDVVVRVVNIGPVPIAVERVAIELETDELIDLDAGAALPHTLTRPDHLERRRDRESLRRAVGTRRIRRLVAIGTDGRRYYGDVDAGWRTVGTWPS